MGLVYDGLDSIWSYLGITGAVYFTGAIAVILFGLYWEKASSVGAVAALLGGLSALLGLEPIRKSISIFSTFQPEQIGLMTLAFSMILMIVCSLIFPDKKKGYDNLEIIWQLLFVIGFLSFNLIFIFFSIKGYRELKELLNSNDEK